jgi:hypothetical protein
MNKEIAVALGKIFTTRPTREQVEIEELEMKLMKVCGKQAIEYAKSLNHSYLYSLNETYRKILSRELVINV